MAETITLGFEISISTSTPTESCIQTQINSESLGNIFAEFLPPQGSDFVA